MKRVVSLQAVAVALMTATMVSGQSTLADQADVWGYGRWGQLGNGTRTSSSSTPAAVPGLSSEVTAVAVGTYHCLALQNGVVYAWGSGNYGDLGYGQTGDRLSPVPVSGLSSVTAIAAGDSFSLALQSGGVYAWGYNGVGDVGDGTTQDRYTPVAVSGLSSGVTLIAAGYAHALAVQMGAYTPGGKTSTANWATARPPNGTRRLWSADS